MTSDRKFFEKHAKELVQGERQSCGISYWRLNELLREGGVFINDQSLINKLNRGKYSFAFALQVLHAMGVKAIDIPQPQEQEAATKWPKRK